MSGSAQRRRLGSFLRAHRERLRPSDVGFPETPRRRTPGLRREEAAALSGVGLAWYTWLEQGGVAVSRQVLESVSRTLRLDADAHRHVMTLAGFSAPSTSEPSDALSRLLQPVLDSWTTSPAVLLDRHFDLLAWNSAYSALWPDPMRFPEGKRNLLWFVVADTSVRDSLHDWRSVAIELSAQFRAEADRYSDDKRMREILAMLRRDSPELGEWWDCRTVREFTSRSVTMNAAGVGELRLLLSLFRPVDSGDALLLVQTPVAEIDRQRLTRLLASPRQCEQTC